jgi:Protein of unknown function (DUF3169)
MKHSFSTKVLIVVLLYVMYRFAQNKVWTNEEYALESTVVYVSNIVCLVLLLVTSMLSRKIVTKGEESVAIEEEDNKQLFLERTFHRLTFYSQLAQSIGVVTLIGGFLLIRDMEPRMLLYTIILWVLTWGRMARSMRLISYIRPDFTLPNPKAVDYKDQLLDCYDDGEKYVMLKSLHKLYYALQCVLITLMFVLMFYSIFSGVSQLFSIIAIGVVMLFMQLYYLKGVQIKN